MKVEPALISEETRYKEFEKWNSLMHMRLIMEVEEKYDVEIPIEDVPNIMTLKELYRYTQVLKN